MASALAAGEALKRETAPTISATFELLLDRLRDAQTRATRFDSSALFSAQTFVNSPGPGARVDPTVFSAIQEAILSYKVVKVFYRKAGGDTAREYMAEPYGIIFGSKNYLVWRGTEDKKYRKFALPYIEKITPTKSTFTADEEFSLEVFATSSFGVMLDEILEVELLVLPEGQAKMSGFHFHPSQQIEEHDDGSSTVRFRASGINEICWHLFSWGKSIRVVSPDTLRDTYEKLIGEAKEALT